MSRILITGGCGFIGHHVVEHYIKNTDHELVVLDKLTYAACGFDRLRDISVFDTKRVRILTADFTRPLSVGLLKECGKIDYVVHLGAETHVDNSIKDPWPFVEANVIGTYNMLEFARKLDGLSMFLYFSTDEVFGPAPVGVSYKEWDRYNSTNPYAATKAGGEELCLSYATAFKLPVMVTHTMNVFGERQHPEKFIPLVINRCLSGEKVFIHSDASKTIPGTRFYIHARNVAAGMEFVLEHGGTREKYNIRGELEVNNLELAQKIARVVGKPLNFEMVDFHSSRPGHDLRYALDGSRLKDMGWQTPVEFDESLARTVRWFLKNDRWLKPY
jgi:dTDP-glucose 4,6-dehydratase